MSWSVAAAALAVLGVGLDGSPAGAAGTRSYTQTQTIPVPPASAFTGSAGGDGWNVALSPTAVYNVFHHNFQLQVACHKQADASNCWTAGASKTITVDGIGFDTPSHSGAYLDPANGHLYTYATRQSDGAVGVVCVDTTQPDANPNPSCGFTALANGDPSGIPSNGMVVGPRLYAFNYVNGSTPAAGRDQVLCFDMAAAAACAGQPFSVAVAAGAMDVGTFPVPSTAAIGTRLLIPVRGDSPVELTCFDTATAATCTGAWPVPLTSGVDTIGAPYPLLSAAGAITGVCMPDGAATCFDLAGASASAPAGLAAAIGSGTGWNGPAVTIGNRVYVAVGIGDQVGCYDFGAGAQCANFPHPTTNSNFLYTVNPDPQRPSCIWVNADGGSAQIQNFDAFSGQACGEGPIRILASSFVPPAADCAPLSYTKLQVTDPPRTAYSSGSVAFRDGSGAPIPSTPDAALDATGSVSLTGLNLNANGLPQFLLTLNGLGAHPPAVTVALTWTGPDTEACGGSPEPTRTPTTLQAEPLILKVQYNAPTLSIAVRVTAGATLRDAAGHPLAGKPVRFHAGGVNCTGTTNAQGRASCFGILSTGWINALLGLGYDAAFAGDANYLPSAAHGSVVNVLGLTI